MHSFVGDAAMGEACLAMGLMLSFAGMLTYKNAAALREAAAKLPLDKLFVETDSPYLSPVPVRGKRNEPAHVVHTAACLAGAARRHAGSTGGADHAERTELFAL